MATNSPELGVALLDALAATDVAFAVFHNERGIAANEVYSDLDLVVDRDPNLVVHALGSALAALGLSVVARTNYDHCAIGYFLVDPAATRSLQLDLVHDPRGRGKFGIRTDIALAAARQGERWMTLSEIDEVVYLLFKRHLKQDQSRFREVKARGPSIGTAQIEERARTLLTRRSRRALNATLKTGLARSIRTRDLSYHLRTVSRYARRVARPAGFWLHVEDSTPELSEALAHRFATALPISRSIGTVPDNPRRTSWWLQTVAPLRWRPDLAVSYGGRVRGFPRPDLSLHPAELSDLCRSTTRQMADRAALRRPFTSAQRTQSTPDSRCASRS